MYLSESCKCYLANVECHINYVILAHDSLDHGTYLNSKEAFEKKRLNVSFQLNFWKQTHLKTCFPHHVPLSTYVRPWTKDHQQTDVLSQLKKIFHISVSAEIVLARSLFMVVPGNVAASVRKY